MQRNVIDKIRIDGEFVTPHGTELVDLLNPAIGQVIWGVQLADEVDIRAAVAAAKSALPGLVPDVERRADRRAVPALGSATGRGTKCWIPPRRSTATAAIQPVDGRHAR